MKIADPTFYRTRIKDWPADERPREKLMAIGPDQLSDSELIAILFRTGGKQHTAVDLAKTIISNYGGLHALAQIDFRKFFQIKGIGPAKAITLAAAFEIARRIAALPKDLKLKITCPEDVYRKYGPHLGALKKEVFMVLLLNSANILMRDYRVSEGTLNSSLVHPREVFQPAVSDLAASVILMHNHPSGEVNPSAEDRNITRRLVEVGKLMDIPVLDHIIIGSRGFFSFKEAGLIGNA
ncbi:MAG: DNA repair protein RadC [Calditrichia bacterium]